MKIKGFSKKLVLGFSFLFLFLFVFSSFAVDSKGRGMGKMEGKGRAQEMEYRAPDMPVATSSYTLSEEEKQDLIYIRQEEKLARDVYLALYEKWGRQIFSNIAKSEQKHTDSVRNLLDKYNLQDPITDDSRGVFKDKEFVDLYNSLVKKGSSSEVEALKVGAEIEELDIKDLEEKIVNTDNSDIVRVYTNLMNGSKNHLRAFVSQLKEKGENYEPQHISSEEYEEIISTDQSKASKNARERRGKGISLKEAERELKQGKALIEELGFKSQYKIMERIRSELKLNSEDKISIFTENGKTKIKIKKQVKILGLFKIDLPIEVEVNKQGDYKINKPWWSFIFGF